MPLSIDVVDNNNSVIETLEIKDEIFNVRVKPYLLHSAVTAYLTNQRIGTSSTKNRAAVRGGGAKPWKQKGTGRARAGSLRTPLRRGGGIVFGPSPRDYSCKISKKEKREALKSSLTQKVKEGKILIVDKIELEQPKTKQLISFINKLGISGKILFVVSEENKNLELAARNVQGIDVNYPAGLNTYNILYHDKIVCSKEAIENISKRLTN